MEWNFGLVGDRLIAGSVYCVLSLYVFSVIAFCVPASLAVALLVHLLCLTNFLSELNVRSVLEYDYM